MLFAPDRHELTPTVAWDETRARDAIRRIVQDTEQRFSPATLWPAHPLDAKDPEPQYTLYMGACGVIWALQYLQAQGAASLSRDYAAVIPGLLAPNRAQMGVADGAPFGAYLMGDTSIRLLEYWANPSDALASELARLIDATRNHPARELMWGSPGTLLAALFMQQRTGESRWADLFRDTAAVLWSQLEWSDEHSCHYWTQDLYGERSSYIDGVHGFVATASPLIQGHHLLKPADWERWRECIANTVRRTAQWEGELASWRVRLSSPRGDLKLMQFCHGAPGFVICLADFPDDSLDDLLIAGAQATWAAGPLKKGSNLCHGTGGNGYAFLKLYRRTGNTEWLDRARAFAMRGIEQTDAAHEAYGQMRYSLWTGDPGFAIYLWDCIRGQDRFPTLDVFFG
ncbi:MAG TPA: LanC-like protein [Burkholderiaceae bacterium]|nr:LanC-like protein [Burkholderiaceae bacterium]